MVQLGLGLGLVSRHFWVQPGEGGVQWVFNITFLPLHQLIKSRLNLKLAGIVDWHWCRKVGHMLLHFYEAKRKIFFPHLDICILWLYVIKLLGVRKQKEHSSCNNDMLKQEIKLTHPEITAVICSYAHAQLLKSHLQMEKWKPAGKHNSICKLDFPARITYVRKLHSRSISTVLHTQLTISSMTEPPPTISIRTWFHTDTP